MLRNSDFEIAKSFQTAEGGSIARNNKRIGTLSELHEPLGCRIPLLGIQFDRLDQGWVHFPACRMMRFFITAAVKPMADVTDVSEQDRNPLVSAFDQITGCPAADFLVIHAYIVNRRIGKEAVHNDIRNTALTEWPRIFHI